MGRPRDKDGKDEKDVKDPKEIKDKGMMGGRFFCPGLKPRAPVGPSV